MPFPVGYIYHQYSGKAIHPYRGSANPSNDTKIVVYQGKRNACQFQFQSVSNRGHCGYIKHHSSGKYLHSYGGTLDPYDNTDIVIHEGNHQACLFAFDEIHKLIVHWGGKYWHPYNSEYSDDTRIVLYEGYHDKAKFYFGDANETAISAYGTPNLTGEWELVRAFVEPNSDQTFGVKYKVGKSREESKSTEFGWMVSAEFSYSFFSASAELSGNVSQSSSEIWEEEVEHTYELNVTAGRSVWLWQYTLGMSQFNETKKFLSAITGTTHSAYDRPNVTI